MTPLAILTVVVGAIVLLGLLIALIIGPPP